MQTPSLCRIDSFVAKHSPSTGSSQLSPVSKSLVQLSLATPSSRGPFAAFSSVGFLSPYHEADLLQAPMIDTPESVAKFETPWHVVNKYCRTFNLCDDPPEDERVIGPTTCALDDLDLVLCHQDFPHPVEMSTNVGTPNVELSAVSDFLVAIERMNMRFAGGGKNLTIERGQYEWTNRTIDFLFIDCELDQYNLEAKKGSNFSTPPSIIFTKNPSVGNCENIEELKRDILIETAIGDDRQTIFGIDDLPVLSQKTGVSVADIVSYIKYIKSRGRTEVKLSLLLQLMQNTKADECISVDCIGAPPMASPTRSKWQTYTLDTTPAPSKPCAKRTGSKSRPSTDGGASSTTKVPFRKTKHAPSPTSLWYCVSSYQVAMTPKSRSSIRYNTSCNRSAKRSTSEKRHWSSQTSVAAEIAAARDPCTTKRPRQNLSISSLSAPNGTATPLSDLSFVTKKGYSVDASFLGRVVTFFETPSVAKYLSFPSPSILLPAATDLDSTTEEIWECFEQYCASLFCFNSIKEESDDGDRDNILRDIEAREAPSCPVNKQLFLDDEQESVSDKKFVPKIMAFQFV
jgi:hypothetical protein